MRYADHADGVMDLHLPATVDDAPVVFLVHGGFWRTAWDRTHTRDQARAIADEGFVVATPEYRRVGPGGYGGWPTTGEDVLAALNGLPALATAAGLTLSSEPPRALGHSAGGHLVLWLSTTRVAVHSVVALAPLCDLGAAIERGLGSDAARDFLGGIEPATADPMVLFDDAVVPPVEIVHGVEDDIVPVDLARGFVRRHPATRLTEVPGGHFEPITPGSVAWPAVSAALRA